MKTVCFKNILINIKIQKLQNSDFADKNSKGFLKHINCCLIYLKT